MKTKFTLLLAIGIIVTSALSAQTNTFPQTGNVGIGTLTPATSLQVIGKTRMGSATDYAQVDDNGSLTFKGSGVYKVGGNKYAFQYSTSPGYGLFFNSTDAQYEFRDAAARPVFYVNANTGDGYFLSGVRIGNSLVSTTGNLRWNGSDFQGYNGSTWLSLTGGQSWGLKGNANTDASTNFIGTTDNKPLIFKVNNHVAGYVAGTNSNTTFGYEAQLDDSDVASTAFGYVALRNNLGLFNTGIGLYALNGNTTGGQNTALGANTLRENTTGNDNTGLGHLVLASNTTGGGNTGAGNGALSGNTIGASNSAFGNVALQLNTTGDLNTAIGSSALSDNTIGNHNTATGGNSLSANTAGEENTANGAFAAFQTTTGSKNVAIGVNALYDNTTGLNNLAIGYSAGRSNHTGSNNTSVGSNANPGGDFSNNTTLGYSAVGTADNQVRIGNSSVTSIGGFKGWTNLSDGRIKKNIKANVPGLAFINLLKPLTYTFDLDAADKITVNPSLRVGNGKLIQPSPEEITARHIQEQIVSTGFIAQDVEAAAKKIGYDFDGVDAPKNDKDLYGLRYSEFVVPLVKAVQELSAKNEELEQRLQKLEALLQKGTTANSNSQNQSGIQTSNAETASIEQNIPNPANGNTVIRYYLPLQTKTALLQITDAGGRIVKTVSLTVKGAGQTVIAKGDLQSGNYFYTLVTDGKKIATKQMILVQ